MPVERPGLSVVIRSKDEAPRLALTLAALECQADGAEIVVVDDGSTDATPAIARAHGARVVSHAESLGNGAAVKRGIREAKGDWILLLDGDGQHPPQELRSTVTTAKPLR